MATHTNLDEARAAHREHGGVLLDLGESTYQVVEFAAAVDMRHDVSADRYAVARYWATLGEHGYDETDPLFRRVMARTP
jgi:hypothetical protein